MFFPEDDGPATGKNGKMWVGRIATGGTQQPGSRPCIVNEAAAFDDGVATGMPLPDGGDYPAAVDHRLGLADAGAIGNRDRGVPSPFFISAALNAGGCSSPDQRGICRLVGDHLRFNAIAHRGNRGRPRPGTVGKVRDKEQQTEQRLKHN